MISPSLRYLKLLTGVRKLTMRGLLFLKLAMLKNSWSLRNSVELMFPEANLMYSLGLL